MGYLILPTLILMLLPTPGARAHQLEDFSRFSRAIGQEVSLVDKNGLIREGVLEAATADGVTLRFGSATESFPRGEVASAERTTDGRIDGTIKGALLGIVLTALASQGYDSTTPGYVPWVSIAAYAGAGYLLDAAEAHRQPLYRAPTPPAPKLKVSLRF